MIMKPATLLLSAFVATLRSSFGSLIITIAISSVFGTHTHAQTFDSLINKNFSDTADIYPQSKNIFNNNYTSHPVFKINKRINDATHLFTADIHLETPATSLYKLKQGEPLNFHSNSFRANHLNFHLLNTDTSTLTAQQIKKRVWLVAGANVVGYSGIMVALSAAWYKGYPKSSFHFFDDHKEWMQVDKVGHFYSAYVESTASSDLWKWTGINRKTRIWLGGLSGAVYQTVIETLDGFSAEWGWSWSDFAANILGSGTFIAQELGWDEQRIKLKWSFHKKNYKEPMLNDRSDELFGKSAAERFLKDYNGQTYWASTSIKSFFPNSKLPAWLSVAVGYGAEGMFGGESNIAKDENGNIIFDRSDIPRYRQWYLSPDIDFSRIKTKSKAVRLLFTVLNAFKFPFPSIEFSKKGIKLNAIHF
ncbi:MAG TPA: DUF2279 domain-containing protein [Chitinophagaceae bacterium]|nr:DUF2279 domain-containing protein [Chitinophagaceae bacterium]